MHLHRELVLAFLYERQGRYSEAEPLYQQALEMFEKWLGVDHPNTVTIRENLEDLLNALREREKQDDK